MTTENPFEVSQLCTGAGLTESPFASSSSFRVEGDILVCGNPVVLPPICAENLSRENLVGKVAQVQYGSFRLVLMQRTCSVTYFVRSRPPRGLSAWHGFSMIGVITAIILLIGKSQNGDAIFALVILTILIVSAVVQFSKRKDSIQLTLDSYQSPGIYRIRGFSRQYLDSISRLATDFVNG